VMHLLRGSLKGIAPKGRSYKCQAAR
jgi:hypothetical protein